MSSHHYHLPCHHHYQGYPGDQNQENHYEIYPPWDYQTEPSVEKHLQSVILAETPEKVLLLQPTNQAILQSVFQLMSELLMPLDFHLKRQ